jgi:hypothetical protein
MLRRRLLLLLLLLLLLQAATAPRLLRLRSARVAVLSESN